jgi:hypothetical protein
MGWFYTTNDPREKVIAFYVKALAIEQPAEEDGKTTFRITPAGAESLGADRTEQVYVAIETKENGLTSIQLGEELKAGKWKWKN